MGKTGKQESNMFFQSINDMLGEGDTLVFMVNKGGGR